MTKYILHGGETKVDCESNDNFFREFFKADKKPIRILLCYFAKADEKLPSLAEEDKQRLKSLSGAKSFETKVAAVEQFTDQLKNSDVLYIRGGDAAKLYRQLSQFDLKTLFDGKTIAASSAGVYVLSKYYYSESRKQIVEGFGVLPIKTSCHFGRNVQESEMMSKLDNYNESLPIISLPETEFKIIKQ